jgi:hypothetical protein
MLGHAWCVFTLDAVIAGNQPPRTTSEWTSIDRRCRQQSSAVLEGLTSGEIGRPIEVEVCTLPDTFPGWI